MSQRQNGVSSYKDQGNPVTVMPDPGSSPGQALIRHPEVFEVTKKVGPGGHFLGETHTLNSNLFIFDSQHNNPFEQWELEGKLDSEQVGINKAKKWLDKYEAPEIDQGLDQALLDYIERRSLEIPVQAL